MKTQTKLIALAAGVAIAAGATLGARRVARAFGNVGVTPTTYLPSRCRRAATQAALSIGTDRGKHLITLARETWHAHCGQSQASRIAIQERSRT